MISINVIDDKISGSYGDTPFCVDFDEKVYKQMQDLAEMDNKAETVEEYEQVLKSFSPLTVMDYTKTVESQCEFIHINKGTGEFFLKHNGVVSSIPMPKALVDRIFESIDKGVSFDPLVKMWTRWLRNSILRRKTKKGFGMDFSTRFFNFVNMQYVHPKLKKSLWKNTV